MPKPNQPRTKSKKKVIIILCAAALLIVLLIIGVSTWNLWRPMNAEETRFANYLDTKYGKEFVVRDIKTEGAGFAVKGFRKGQAYLKDDKGFVFTVSYGGEKNSDVASNYGDNYLSKLWGKEEAANLRMAIGSIFNQVPDYSVEVSPPFVVQNDVHGSVPTLESMEAKYPSQISYRLVVSVQNDFTDSVRRKQYVYAYKLVQLLQTKTRLNARLTYSNYLTSSRTFTAERYQCSLESSQVRSISKLSDIEACFIKQGVPSK